MRRHRPHASALPCPPAVKTVVDRRIGEVLERVTALEETVARMQTVIDRLAAAQADGRYPSSRATDSAPPDGAGSSTRAPPGQALERQSHDATAGDPSAARVYQGSRSANECVEGWILPRLDSD